MRALLSAILILLFAIRALSAAEPGAAGPSNPFFTDDAIYLSADGLTKYDRRSLSPRWRVLAGMELSDPVASGSLVFAGGSSGLFALQADSGEVVWEREMAGRQFSPVVVGDTVIAASEEGVLAAVDTRSGAIRWSRKFDGWIYPPAVAGGVLVVTGSERVLYGLEPETGAERWRSILPQEPAYGPRSVAGRYAVVNAFDGSIRMVRGADGAMVWVAKDGVASQAPVVFGEILYFPGYDGVLRARAATDGTLLWSRRTHGALALPPDPSAGLLIVGSGDGEIVALDSGSGEKRWSRSAGMELLASPRLDDGRLLLFTPGAVMAWKGGALNVLSRQASQLPGLSSIPIQPRECQR